MVIILNMKNVVSINEIKNIRINQANNSWDIHVILSNGKEIKRSRVITPDLFKEFVSNYLIDKLTVDEDYVDNDIPSYIIEMRRIYNEEYNGELSLSTLEDTLGVSKYRLCHEFTQYYGISPLQYLINLRMSAACRLLENTNMKVYEIGINVGYENTNHFINLFKSQKGTTPTKYRREHMWSHQQ